MARTTLPYSPEAVRYGLRQGDQAVINWFYAYLKPQAFRIFCRSPRGSREHQAMEDCFNAAFYTFLQKVESGQCRAGKLKAFALGIVRNYYRDALKKMHRHPWQELSADFEPAATESPRPYLNAGQLFEAEGHFHLLHWYQALPRQSQLVLDLRVQGFNNKEIAQHLPLSHGMVRNRYSALVQEAKEMVGRA